MAMGLSLLSTPVMALDDEWTGQFHVMDQMYFSKGVKPPEVNPYGSLPSKSAFKNKTVTNEIARITREELGEKWVPTALKLAKIESNYRCNIDGPRTAHGRAHGVFQLIDGSARALGFDPKRLHECDYGIRAGIAHMKKCIDAGVATHNQMSACHVAGWAGWNMKLARRSERYKQKYIRMAMI